MLFLAWTIVVLNATALVYDIVDENVENGWIRLFKTGVKAVTIFVILWFVYK